MGLGLDNKNRNNLLIDKTITVIWKKIILLFWLIDILSSIIRSSLEALSRFRFTITKI